MDLPMRDGARKRALAAVTSLLALAGLVVAVNGFAADIPVGNLTTNPSFESGMTGWSAWHATSAAVTAADAPNGAKVAEVTRSASNTSYTLEQYYAVNSANSARGGQTYTATAWVKGTTSTAGKTVKLRLREWTGSSVAGSAEASVTLNTSGYQQLTLTYTGKTTGQAMTLDVLREGVTAAESFYVDAISLTVQQPALIPAANVATNPSFETDVADWDFWHGTGARVVLADAPHGTAAAQVTRAGTNSSYDIERYYDANTANSAQANHTYAINAWVRGTSSTNTKTAKLRIREWNPNGSLAGSAESSVTLESAKFKLVQLSYVAKTDGNALTVDIRRDSVTAAESFYADAITITVADPLPAPNVWDNPSVETDLSEWGGWQADIARVTQPAIPDPPDGIAAVEVTRQSGHSEYGLNSWTGNFTAGNYTYHATAWVKGTAASDGKTVSLRLREWDAAAQLVDSDSTEVTLDEMQWTQVELAYTAQATGHDFGLDILREGATGSESFYADAITITKTAPATIPADNLIANPSFETDTSGWDSWNGDPLVRTYAPTITDAPHGTSVVKVAQSASPPSPDQYNLDYWSADELVADHTYTVSAWVRGTASTDGKTVTLRLREYGTGSEVLGSETEPVTLEDDHFKQVALNYVALGGGSALGLDILREGVTGPESFYADAITMIDLPPDETEPEIAFEPGPIEPDGSSTVTVTATDPGSVSTGVTHLELFLDGQPIDTPVDRPCPDRGCSITRVVSLSPSQNLADHELDAVSYDGGENAKTEVTGKVGARFNQFGYGNLVVSEQLPLAQASGANVIRFPVPWCVFEPSKNGYQWGTLDLAFQELAAKNMTGIPMLFAAPQWARQTAAQMGPGEDAEHLCEVSAPPAQTTEALNQWEQFAKLVVERYGPSGSVTDNLLAVELWNEPNLAKFWFTGSTFNGGNEARFAELVNRGSQGAITGDPDVRVFAGGLSPAPDAVDPVAFMQDATNGPGEDIEPDRIGGISIHLYSDGFKHDEPAIEHAVSDYVEFTDSLEGQFASKSRWVTEIGFPAAGLGYGTESRQRNRLDVTYTKLAGRDQLKSYIVYNFKDENSNLPSYGVLDTDGNPRRAYCALARRQTGESNISVPDPPGPDRVLCPISS